MDGSLSIREKPPAFGFAALDCMHRDLDALFLNHQEYLVMADVPRARDALEEFAERLALHIRQEEDRLLPVYAERLKPPASAREPTAIYRLEHRKIDQLLGRLRNGLGELESRPLPVHIIRLLDRGLVFKHVLEHHGERERSLLYPQLDRLCPPDLKDRIVKACLTEWAHPGTAFGPPRLRMRSASGTDA